jgi:hypothetical protein
VLSKVFIIRHSKKKVKEKITQRKAVKAVKVKAGQCHI